MKIETKDTSELSLKSITPGTAFWWNKNLYMKTEDINNFNVVSLANGDLYKWNLANVSIAKVKIVQC